MSSGQSLGGLRRSLLPACALIILSLAAFATASRALAQSGAPAPGWIQLPGGEWVPPGHPLATAAATPPTANPACGLHTLSGSYIISVTGYNIVGGVPQPKAVVEVVEFHGDGTLGVPAATSSINGTINRAVSGAGSYTLEAECTGTLAFGPGPSFDIFTDNTGKEVWMIQNNPNTVAQATASKVSP